MQRVRPPAVAGRFYAADPAELQKQVRAYLRAASGGPAAPRALIAPHAGYLYSGSVAAAAYAWLRPGRERIGRVVLVGPAHWVYLEGLALPAARAFATPLGVVPVDAEAAARIETLPQVHISEQAHVGEHSLEVHLPFLQEVLGEFALVPLLVGRADPEEVCQVMEMLWGGEETLFVVSSDLSHFCDYEKAKELDGATARAIEALRDAQIGAEQACGCIPIQGLLRLARRRGLRARTLELRNSGDVAGGRERVVGYGAYVFTA